MSFEAKIVLLLLCYAIFIKIQEHLELAYEQWIQIILKLFKNRNFYFRTLGISACMV